jgi:hypothetical protein
MTRAVVMLVLAIASATVSAQPEGPEALPLGAMPAGQITEHGRPLLTEPQRQSQGSSIGTVPALALVLGLAISCAGAYRWIASRSGGLAARAGAPGAPAGILDLLGRYPMGRGQSLLLLRVDRRILLVSQSAGARVGAAPALATLCEITDPDEVASITAKASSSQGGFGSVIARFQRPDDRPAAPGVEVVDLTRRREPSSRSLWPTRRQA